MKNKVLQDHKLKFLQLSELGSKLSLAFSSHELVAEKIIGLDGIKKKLLILEQNKGIIQINIIALDEVSSISVKKTYSSIKPGELSIRKVYEFLESIFLQFDFQDERERIVLPFYENRINKTGDLPGLEIKVKNWQIILSKMIGRQNNKLVEEKRQSSLISQFNVE